MLYIRNNIIEITFVLAIAILGILFSTTNSNGEAAVASTAVAVDTTVAATVDVIETTIYTLGAGDKIRLNVFGEENLSGEYEIDGTGVVSIPLINDIKVSGLSLRESEAIIAKKFGEGYLKKPKISIEVLNFRPFFILGEVNKPGSYPYVNSITVINAVAMAGGYTYRAKTSKVMIKRNSIDNGEEFAVKENYKILPGDVIRVLERFF